MSSSRSVGPWQLAVLAGFDAWALAQLIWLGVFALPLDAAKTKARARSEDDSKTSAFLAIITAALISLVGVIVALVKAQHVAHAQKVLLTSVAIATVVLAWATVHAVYVLRYADLYYNGEPGGIDFPGDEPPDYRDFAYLGFTVGMTYQVSDTNIQSRRHPPDDHPPRPDLVPVRHDDHRRDDQRHGRVHPLTSRTFKPAATRAVAGAGGDVRRGDGPLRLGSRRPACCRCRRSSSVTDRSCSTSASAPARR